MAKDFAESFYHSKVWKICRAGFIADRIMKDGGLCQVCHRAPGYIVHHKVYLTPENINDPDVTLNWDNLSYECKGCHDRHPGHGVNQALLPVCEFDLDGNPTGIRPEFADERG